MRRAVSRYVREMRTRLAFGLGIPSLLLAFACSGSDGAVDGAGGNANADAAAPTGSADAGAGTEDGAAPSPRDGGTEGGPLDPCSASKSGALVRARAFDVLGEARDATLDAKGGLWVIGSYTSQLAGGKTAKFGALAAPESSGVDAFVVRRDASGTELWVRGIGTAGEEGVNAVSSDPGDAQGDAFVAGTTSSASITLGATTLTRPFGSLGWIARFGATDGAPAWARAIIFGTAGTPGQFGRCDSMAARGGKLFVGCRANVSLTYEDANQQTKQLPAVSGTTTTTYVLRLDPATGNVTWAISLGASGEIAVSPQGDLVVVGGFDGTSVKDSGNGCTALRTGSGRNVVAATLDPQTGACTGIVAHGSPLGTAGTGVSSSRVGLDAKALLTGSFEAPLTLGGTQLTAAAASGFDAYVGLFDKATSPVASWVRSLPMAMSAATFDACGRPAIAVSTVSDVTVDGKVLSSGLHVVGLAPSNGAVTWSRGLLGNVITSAVRGNRLTKGPNGSLALVGGFSGTRDFGDGAPVGLAIGNANQPFVVEYAP